MRGRNGQDRSLQTGKRKMRKGKVDVDIAQQDPRQNKIGPCLGAAGADKFSDSNNSKMRKRKLYRSMGAVLAFSQVFSSSVRRGLSISYTWAW